MSIKSKAQWFSGADLVELIFKALLRKSFSCWKSSENLHKVFVVSAIQIDVGRLQFP